MKVLSIGNWRLQIKEEWKTAFFATWIVGLLAHAYRFFNFLPIWDSMYNFYGIGSTFSLGRWFLPYVGLISSIFDLPWVNGVLSLFYISIAMILLVELFGIRRRLPIILCSAAFVSFPTVVSSFAYMYTADAYMLSFLLAVLAVYLTFRIPKWGMFFGMISLAFGMGIYQAYATTCAVLVLVFVIHQFVTEKPAFFDAVKRDLKYLWMLLGGALLYYIILKLTLWHFNTTLSNYQGVGDMGVMSFAQYKLAALQAKYHFQTLLGMEHGIVARPYTLLNAVILLLIFCITLYLLIKNRVFEQKLTFFATFLAILLIPFVAYGVYFTSPSVEYHTLMEMGVCFLYLLFLLLVDQLEWKNALPKILKCAGAAAMCALVYYNVLNSNIAYFNLNLSYHKSYAIAENILDRIEDNKHFETCKKVALVGQYSCPTENVRTMVPNIMGISNDSFLNDSYHYTIFWNNCFGVNLEAASYQKMEKIKQTKAFQEMPVYPAKGSVKYMKGVIVVKLSE